MSEFIPKSHEPIHKSGLNPQEQRRLLERKPLYRYTPAHSESRTPHQLREAFEYAHGDERVAEWTSPREDGSRTTYSAYEIVFDASNTNERLSRITGFLQRATNAGYTEGFSPIVLPQAGTILGSDKPVTQSSLPYSTPNRCRSRPKAFISTSPKIIPDNCPSLIFT